MAREALRKFEKVCSIIDDHDRDQTKLIPILQAVQVEYRYLPEEILTFVASSLDISPARVFGVATFYHHFAMKPKGKFVIRVCDGTACHVKKSTGLLDALRLRLKTTEELLTTPDMLFTLETVSCLGACGLAPALVVNDEVHGQVTPAKAVDLVRQIAEKEASHAR
jgi:NADH-quinone oxidoreductase subunit E